MSLKRFQDLDSLDFCLSHDFFNNLMQHHWVLRLTKARLLHAADRFCKKRTFEQLCWNSTMIIMGLMWNYLLSFAFLNLSSKLRIHWILMQASSICKISISSDFVYQPVRCVWKDMKDCSTLYCQWYCSLL